MDYQEALYHDFLIDVLGNSTNYLVASNRKFEYT